MERGDAPGMIAEQKKPYEMAINEEWDKMIEYYDDHGARVLFPMTIGRDNALHIAVYSKKEDPLGKLMSLIGYMPFDMVTNEYGNTILHQAAITGNLQAVKLLVKKFPDLISITNKFGETPIFRAASFGQTEIVKFLFDNAKIEDFSESEPSDHYMREDGTSILHVAVQGEYFETALYLLQINESLANLKDKNGMTAVHLLANMPSAFKSGYPIMRVLRCCWPIRKGASHVKTKYELAMELAELLVKKDFSWERFVEANATASGYVTTLSYHSKERPVKDSKTIKGTGKEINIADGAGEGSSSENRNGKGKKDPPIPLFIATENGITDFVKQILKEYPQAVEYIDENGRNILQIAIMHRRQDIFDLVTRKRMTVNRLKLGVDNYGYTLLHHAADTEHYTGGSKPGPALQLQEELKWFESVEKLVPSHYTLHRENMSQKNMTPTDLFKVKHEDQLKQAQQWIKDTSQSCSTVAVLVATVVFAAAYTAPGGYEKGVPVFLRSPYFLFFTIMDVVSLACSLTAVVIFLSILTSPFELKEFRRTLPRKLTFGFTLLFLSVITTMLMFGTTILLTIHLEQKLTTSLLSVAAFFPVLVLALMQYHLYFILLDTMTDLSSDTMEALCSCLKHKMD